MPLQWPGKKATSPSGWAIPAKASIYLWLGVVQDKRHYIKGLPPGYEVTQELRYAEKLRINPPITIFYGEKHVSIKNSFNKNKLLISYIRLDNVIMVHATDDAILVGKRRTKSFVIDTAFQIFGFIMKNIARLIEELESNVPSIKTKRRK